MRYQQSKNKNGCQAKQSHYFSKPFGKKSFFNPYLRFVIFFSKEWFEVAILDSFYYKKHKQVTSLRFPSPKIIFVRRKLDFWRIFKKPFSHKLLSAVRKLQLVTVRKSKLICSFKLDVFLSD